MNDGLWRCGWRHDIRQLQRFHHGQHVADMLVVGIALGKGIEDHDRLAIAETVTLDVVHVRERILVGVLGIGIRVRIDTPGRCLRLAGELIALGVHRDLPIGDAELGIVVVGDFAEQAGGGAAVVGLYPTQPDRTGDGIDGDGVVAGLAEFVGGGGRPDRRVPRDGEPEVRAGIGIAIDSTSHHRLRLVWLGGWCRDLQVGKVSGRRRGRRLETIGRRRRILAFGIISVRLSDRRRSGAIHLARRGVEQCAAFELDVLSGAGDGSVIIGLVRTKANQHDRSGVRQRENVDLHLVIAEQQLGGRNGAGGVMIDEVATAGKLDGDGVLQEGERVVAVLASRDADRAAVTAQGDRVEPARIGDHVTVVGGPRLGPGHAVTELGALVGRIVDQAPVVLGRRCAD